MNTLNSALFTTVKSYLKFVPIIIIPIAGILFLVSIAPYHAVINGCKAFGPRQRKKRRELALLFSLSISTLLSAVLLFLSYRIMPIFLLHTLELSIIVLIYLSFTFFSLLGAK